MHTPVPAVIKNSGKKRNDPSLFTERSRARGGEASSGGLRVELSNNQKRMLKALRSLPDDSWSLDQVLAEWGWNDQAHVAGAGLGLAENGLVNVEASKTTVWTLGPEGAAALENELLEQRLWDWLEGQSADARGMKDLQTSEVVSKQETGIGVGLLKGLGCALEKGAFVLPEPTDAAIVTMVARKSFIEQCENGVDESDLDAELLAHFRKRKGLLESTQGTTRIWRLTDAGRRFDDSTLDER